MNSGKLRVRLSVGAALGTAAVLLTGCIPHNEPNTQGPGPLVENVAPTPVAR